MSDDTIRHRILVIGASYGLLPAAKIAAAGHAVTVAGRPDEVEGIARDGIAIAFDRDRVLRPPMGGQGVSLAVPEGVDPDGYDLAILAVQEPQARAPELAGLLGRLGPRLPVASVMNMPPPPFLDRIGTLCGLSRAGAYASAGTWSQLSSEQITLAGPDPQVFRPDPAHPGHLQVTLASNFKFAPFARPADQAVLARIARDASRVRADWGPVPVHLLARGSLFVPLAKWPMLVTGNCRCLSPAGAAPVAIAEAVTRDIAASRLLYDAVNAALREVGAPEAALVPFESYRAAAARLTRPSSLARALAAGAREVERIDLIVLELLRAVTAPRAATALMAEVSAGISEALRRNRD